MIIILLTVFTQGYMTRTARALEQAWRVTWSLDRESNLQRNDPLLVPPSWSEERYERRPTIGYFTGTDPHGAM